MSRSANADRGRLAEEFACDRWGLEHLAPDASAPDWLDTRVRDNIVTDLGFIVVSRGTPVDVKSCWDVYDGRAGRIKIKKSNHDTLLEEDGEYVISVLDREASDVEDESICVLRAALTSAKTVDAMVDTWWPCGRSQRDDGPFVQLPWTRFFDDLRGDDS
ncbi:hypothetical protein [Halomontanus rarus]|uniref:hypothetical protein n=1 Tax=Halomontanus rarus TaxID=3034020 RepID=UPI001A99A621